MLTCPKVTLQDMSQTFNTRTCTQIRSHQNYEQDRGRKAHSRNAGAYELGEKHQQTKKD